MDWEKHWPRKCILVSEPKGGYLDSWNCACTLIFAKAIKAGYSGNRFQALKFYT